MATNAEIEAAYAATATGGNPSKDVIVPLLQSINTKVEGFASDTEILASTDLVDGQTVSLSSGEDFVIENPSALTPNGTTVIGPLAGGGNAVSTRTDYDDIGALASDTRIHPTDTVVEVHGNRFIADAKGASGTEVIGTGNDFYDLSRKTARTFNHYISSLDDGGFFVADGAAYKVNSATSLADSAGTSFGVAGIDAVFIATTDTYKTVAYESAPAADSVLAGLWDANKTFTYAGSKGDTSTLKITDTLGSFDNPVASRFEGAGGGATSVEGDFQFTFNKADRLTRAVVGDLAYDETVSVTLLLTSIGLGPTEITIPQDQRGSIVTVNMTETTTGVYEPDAGLSNGQVVVSFSNARDSELFEFSVVSNGNDRISTRVEYDYKTPLIAETTSAGVITSVINPVTGASVAAASVYLPDGPIIDDMDKAAVFGAVAATDLEVSLGTVNNLAKFVVYWGDGNYDIGNSNDTLTHTYLTAYTGDVKVRMADLSDARVFEVSGNFVFSVADYGQFANATVFRADSGTGVVINGNWGDEAATSEHIRSEGTSAGGGTPAGLGSNVYRLILTNTTFGGDISGFGSAFDVDLYPANSAANQPNITLKTGNTLSGTATLPRVDGFQVDGNNTLSGALTVNSANKTVIIRGNNTIDSLGAGANYSSLATLILGGSGTGLSQADIHTLILAIDANGFSNGTFNTGSGGHADPDTGNAAVQAALTNMAGRGYNITT